MFEHARTDDEVAAFKVLPVVAVEVDGGESVVAVFGQIAIMHDGARTVALIDDDIRGGHLAAGDAPHRREIDVVTVEVGGDAGGVGLLCQHAAPAAAVAELTQHHQGVGAITAAADTLRQRAYFTVFGRVTLDVIDDVERSNADAEDARHGRTGST